LKGRTLLLLVLLMVLPLGMLPLGMLLLLLGMVMGVEMEMRAMIKQQAMQQ
jgi:hypothetical protein